jgi:hypothetical protein
MEQYVKEIAIMYRKLRIFLNLMAQGVNAENMRISKGGGMHEYRLIDVDRAMM